MLSFHWPLIHCNTRDPLNLYPWRQDSSIMPSLSKLSVDIAPFFRIGGILQTPETKTIEGQTVKHTALYMRCEKDHYMN